MSKKILVIPIFLALMAACSQKPDLNLVSTGVLDKCLLDTLNRDTLTAQEYEEIQRKLEEALEINPGNFSVNLLKIQLEKKQTD